MKALVIILNPNQPTNQPNNQPTNQPYDANFMNNTVIAFFSTGFSVFSIIKRKNPEGCRLYLDIYS